MKRVVTLSVVLPALLVHPLLGQPPPRSSVKRPSEPQPSASAAKPAGGQAAKPDGTDRGPRSSKSPDAETPLLQEHVIYVPFKNLKKVFEKQGSSVMVGYDEFMGMWQRLVQAAAGGPTGPGKAPLAGLITQADYTARVEGELVRIEAAFTVQVLEDGWARLPLQFGQAAVGQVHNEDGRVLLRGLDGGRYELLVQGKGSHRVRIELVAHVQASAQGKSFGLRCPAVGVSNLTVEIPERELNVQIEPRRTATLLPGPDGTTQVQAVLGSTDQFRVSWQPKSGVAQMAALANVTETIAVQVGEGVVHTRAELQYEVLRGSLEELAVELPAQSRVLDVQVPGLRDWRSQPADGAQRVTVRLHAPAKGRVGLELQTESALPDGPFAVGRVRAVGVARQSGLIALRGTEDTAIEVVRRAAIARIEPAEAPPSVRKPGSTFYRFFSPQFVLEVSASQRRPQVAVDSFLTVTVGKSRVGTRGRFCYQVSRAGLFAVPLALPAGFQLDQVQCEGMERFELVEEGGRQRLLVHLARRTLGSFELLVQLSRAGAVEAGRFELPLIEPLTVSRERGLVAVYVPESLAVTTEAADLQAARPATPAELKQAGFKLRPPARSTLAAAFAFVRRPVLIALTVAQRPRRVSADVATVATVREDVVQVATTLDYQVRYAGQDTFRIAVPADVADRVQIDGQGIKERRRADAPDQDGLIVWTILLHSEALGRQSFRLTYDRKIAVGEEGGRFELTPVRALDVDRESGQIAVLKDRSLAVTAEPTGVERIDPRELTGPLAGQQPYLCYRYFSHPARLELEVTKHELQEVVKTVVQQAVIEAVVSREGPVTVRAGFELKSSERQRLALTLPAARILGLTVAGRSVPPELAPGSSGTGQRSYLINVARSTDSDTPFRISLLFEMPLSPKRLATTGRLRLPLPQFESGVKYQSLYVRVWVPDRYELVGEPAGFTSRNGTWWSQAGLYLFGPPRRMDGAELVDGWFSAEPTTFAFQTAGHDYLYRTLSCPSALSVQYWHSPTMALLASAVVLAAGLVLVFFRVGAKVSMVFVAVLAALFTAMFQPELVGSWLAAARLGVGGVMVLWLIGYGLRSRPRAASTGGLAAAAAGGGAGAGAVALSGPDPGRSPPAELPSERLPDQPHPPPPTPPPTSEADSQGQANQEGGGA